MNRDLEKLYHSIGAHIDLMTAYTKIEMMPQIIRTCRLKPYSIFIDEFNPTITYDKHWVDEFGNSLMFEPTTILLNDTTISENTRVSTDLFFGSGISSTADNSKSLFAATGNYFGSDFIVAAFYGHDEYIRSFVKYNKWYRISPLLLGLNTIREILKNTNNYNPVEISKDKLDFVWQFDIKRCVLIPLQTKQEIPAHFRVVMDTVKEK